MEKTILQILFVLVTAHWWYPFLRDFMRDIEAATRPEKPRPVHQRGATRLKEFGQDGIEVRQRLINARWDTGEKRQARTRTVSATRRRSTWQGGFGRRGL